MQTNRTAWSLVWILCVSLVRCTGLEWETRDGFLAARLSPTPDASPGFTARPARDAGIPFINRLADERSLTNQVYLNGSGVAAGDVDGDGWVDLYFCGLDSPNALYRNLGNWSFQEVTSQAGVACADQASTGAALADLDGDADLDLVVNGIRSGTRIFINNGRGQFTELAGNGVFDRTAGSSSLAIADVDGDGFLDIYVVNYRSDTIRDMPDIRFRVVMTNNVPRLVSVNGQSADAPGMAGRFTLDRGGGILENGEADVLYRNLGRGGFRRVDWGGPEFVDSEGKPAAAPFDWGLSAMFRDVNGDGAPDLYVCNDFQSPDRLWMNDGSGRFREAPARTLAVTSLFSMGVDFADVNRDGLDDFFVADMLSRDPVRRAVQVLDGVALSQARGPGQGRPQFQRNTLMLNRGDQTFAEVGRFAGVDASEWSWCPVFMDVDLDGFEDLLITTGHWRDSMNADVARTLEADMKRTPLPPQSQLMARRAFPRLNTPNIAFRNNNGTAFTETGALWGFDSTDVSHGICLADLDNDGDGDVVVNCLNAPPLLLQNRSARPRLAIRLDGASPNTRGIGARIVVRQAGLPPQTQEMICGGRYLSSDDPMRTFAMASPSARAEIEVLWRSGRRSLLTNVEPNLCLRIPEPREPASAPRMTPLPPAPAFRDLSTALGHRHADPAFEEAALQPGLPRTLSHAGPSVAWFDFNGDGWDDLFVGAAAGGKLSVFRNDTRGGFVPQRAKLLDDVAATDHSSLLAWEPSAGSLSLLLGTDAYEGTRTNAAAFRELSMTTGESGDGPLRSPGASGPMCLGDIDGDGDLDLFVGIRARPGRYPEPQTSHLLLNRDGRFHPDPEAGRVLQSVGLVNGATLVNLDGDSRPELVLACEWGGIRLFRWVTNRLEEWKAPLTTAAGGAIPDPAFVGWWNSVAAGDFDNDGRMDLACGNWGRNQSRAPGHAATLFYGDLEGAGRFALMEAGFDPVAGGVRPTRDLGQLSTLFPMLRDRFPTFEAFGRARMEEVLAADLPPMLRVDAAWFDSCILLNRGGSFEVRPLPTEAQWSATFGIATADLDGDGNQDLFLAQNVFGTHPPGDRQDAGVGLWLRGDGHGQFSPVPPASTGFDLTGEARSVAVSDFNHDGRADLVVGQNNGTTRLYQNLRAVPGLRVVLTGTAANPRAVGARVRPVHAGRPAGPVQEIRVGGGYWSQDSAQLLLALPEQLRELEVVWPSGKVQRLQVDPDATELRFSDPSGR